ncbi:hypothetical protein [Pseudomonas sp. LRF_L74]|uniref:hypothetical protein n=1 Tax=Pseudomonas sp. LRF_L74 TaxID=3369422 RepID=UPI003F62CDFB
MIPSEQPNPLSDLSDSLGTEYSQSRAAQRDRVIAELKQVIERVPEQTEFTNSRRYKLWGPLIALVSLGITFGGIKTGGTGLTWCGVGLVLFGLTLTWQHRNSGTKVFMRLTRCELLVDTLSAPVDLAEVEDISVKDEGMIMAQQLELSSEAALPTHRVVHLQFFCDQAMVLKKPRPQIRIMSAGVMTGGRTLKADEMAALLGAYRDAACAQRQLNLLLNHG